MLKLFRVRQKKITLAVLPGAIADLKKQSFGAKKDLIKFLKCNFLVGDVFSLYHETKPPKMADCILCDLSGN